MSEMKEYIDINDVNVSDFKCDTCYIRKIISKSHPNIDFVQCSDSKCSIWRRLYKLYKQLKMNICPC